MRGIFNHIVVILAGAFLLGCADVGEVPRLEKSDTSGNKGPVQPTDDANKNPAPSSNVPNPNPTTNPAPSTPTPNSLEVKWVSASNGSIPQNGIPMGTFQGTALYLCRASLGANILLGAISATGMCVIPYEPTIFSTEYEILVLSGGLDANLVLVDVVATSGTIPSGAFAAGQEAGVPTYPCRVSVSRSVFVGKARAGYLGCLFNDGYSDRVSATYSVVTKR